ncbi:hypothetical protein [Streptosporangium carneum]|uniref:hypothetical protein n=1 Tax=Streptosporangium carneum TaxID=47481 RepID=UPI0022F30904|nr:hypothetical protein [Streptosporangium carneum]
MPDDVVATAALTASSDRRPGLRIRYALKNATIAVPAGRKAEFDLSADTVVGSFPHVVPTHSGRHLTRAIAGRNDAAALTTPGGSHASAGADATTDQALPRREFPTRSDAPPVTAGGTDHIETGTPSGATSGETNCDVASSATAPDNGLR